MKGLLLVGMGALAIGSIALITGCGGHHKRGCLPKPEKMANFMTNKISKELKLGPEQKATLNSIKAEFLARQKEKQVNRKELFESAKTIILTDQIDPNALNSLIDEQMENHATTKDFLVSKFIEFHAILTPEQRQLLVDQLEKHQGKFEKFHH